MENNYSRKLEDFIDSTVMTKAQIIEVRLSSAKISGDAFVKFPSSILISSLEYDSRLVKEGSLYFALPGLHVDGHDFISDAVNRGALAVVHQKELSEYRNGIIYIMVKDSRFAMSSISDSFYNHPSRRMGIIGITGTEGKSTTVYLVYQLLKLLGKKTGFISTVQRSDGINEFWNSEHQTTPEAPVIHRLLAEMYNNGVEYAVVESSSHGLSKRTNRLGDVDFDVGVMTNLTHEHLDFHGTWEQYRSDKAELFRALDSSALSHKKHSPQGLISIPSFGVVNADDQSASYFAGATKRKCYSFSTKGTEADLTIKLLESGAGGNWYEVLVSSSGTVLTVRDQLPGAFNVNNVLAALLVVSNLLSMKTEELVHLVSYLKPVRGRMSTLQKGQPFEVIIDYAHTPSSFEAVLPPLRERINSVKLEGGQGRIITLFGSPGERDTHKRKLQGEIAARFSDIVILTDEDPRGEDPMSILEEIAKGCFAAQGCLAASGSDHMIRDETLFLIPDRPQAIRKAFSLAREGDIVLLLGKGHENSIIYADKTMDYDETSEAEKALEEAGFTG